MKPKRNSKLDASWKKPFPPARPDQKVVVVHEEKINHPQHYGGDTTYEHIKVVHAWGLNYELGNATKYICRAGKKDPHTTIEDLKKAIWYVQAEIERLRSLEPSGD